MDHEYVNLKISRDVLREALDLAIMRAERMTYIKCVYATLAVTEQAMEECISHRINYN